MQTNIFSDLYANYKALSVLIEKVIQIDSAPYQTISASLVLWDPLWISLSNWKDLLKGKSIRSNRPPIDSIFSSLIPSKGCCYNFGIIYTIAP